METISSYTHKTGSWYLWEVLFKISNKQPHPFYKGVTLGIEAQFKYAAVKLWAFQKEDEALNNSNYIH